MSQSSIFSDCLKLSKICLYIFLDRSNKLSPIFRTSKYRRLYSLIAFFKILKFANCQRQHTFYTFVITFTMVKDARNLD